MDNYDSILKEKKTYDNDIVSVPKKGKFTKFFIIDVILVIICVFFSYLFYYCNILTSSNVFFNDINKFQTMGSMILKPLNIKFSDESYSLNGDLSFDNYQYQYDVIRDHNALKMSFSNQKHHLIYYLDGSNSYTLFDTLVNHKYVKINHDNLFNAFVNLKSNFRNVISDDDFIKRFYLKGMTPIVEVNLVLNKEKIIQLLNSSAIKDDIELMFTFRNHAISNEIIDGKLVILNKSKNTRYVISLQGDSLKFTDNAGIVTEVVYQFNHSDFILKFNKNDNLYSIFTGTKKENSYVYSYQVIDKIYNLGLKVDYLNDKNDYQFSSNIKENGLSLEKSFHLSFSYRPDGVLEEDITSSVDYSSLKKEVREEFDSSIEEFLLPIRVFVNEYKNSIY